MRVKKEGSSPLTRGKRSVRARQELHDGLIPAHAGKTGPVQLGGWHSGAHPRSRGENRRRLNLCRRPRGSSPLTRGKPNTLQRISVITGLIPAHAGKTSWWLSARWSRPAHPRSRGENLNAAMDANPIGGSSPLTRGKLGDHGLDRVPDGLIPAHAGKTFRCPGSRPCWWAHPRSRGENAPDELEADFLRGSSPLTRGKRSGQTAMRRS